MPEPRELFTIERPAYRLERLEVYNWGPFSGLHRAHIDPGGTAVIGMTGSGKTTLVDAYLTLLAERPKYNLASTGGHESDRDLLSYVRGVIGSGNDSGDASHIARKGKTVTGLCATYGDGDERLALGALFWIDGTGNTAADLKRAWIFSRDDAGGLEDWLTLHHEGGLRRLKQQLRDSGDTVRLFDASTGGKAAFHARVRDFFEVSENAFALLNRAAGLKQLNSIDEIFRDLVLDDRSQFARAAEVVGDFDRLTEIHEELLTAERQQRSLVPVRDGGRQLEHCIEALELHETLKRLLPAWVAENGYRLWNERVETCGNALAEKENAFEAAQAKRDEMERRKTAFHEAFLKAGGQNLEDLEKLIGLSEKEARKRETAFNDYRHACRNLGLEPAANPAAFERSRERIEALRGETQESGEAAQESTNQAGVAFARAQETHDELTAQLQESRARKHTNLPGTHLSLRDALAEVLELDAAALPYVAELIEVRDDESAWRGAIERALGGNRLRLLVPEGRLKAALRWVNAQDRFRLHIRLWEAAEKWPEPARFMDDGFTRKLRFKDHPLREAVKHFLADHDLHCVDSADALADTPHALTREGLASGKRRYFEKKDQRALDEDWLTGFDNRDRLAMLESKLRQAKQTLDETKKRYETAAASGRDLQARLALLHRLADLDFETIDHPGAEAELDRLRERYRQLSQPDSDAGKALERFRRAEADLKTADTARDAAFSARTTAENKLAEAKARREALAERRRDGPTPQESRLLREHLPWPADLRAEEIDAYERRRTAELDTQLKKLLERRTTLETGLVRAMEHAKQADTGALAEAGTALADLPAYLERLRVLEEEALPAKRDKFLAYLNQSSDQGVNQLLATINNEVGQIRERIDELNQSLRKIDFREGRYLRLEVRDVAHESLRTLQRALKQLRAAYARREEDSERHFRALQEVIRLVREAVEKKHTRPALALLDPRYRVEFQGAEIERATEKLAARFKGSQSGSGGEKEIIASYILSASLSYALSPGEGQAPRHATIVLDEAFSKSSRSVARRIINALRVFQLHPIFVTPDKEMRLLRDHTQSVVNVHRKGPRATLTAIRWTELEKRLEPGPPPQSEPDEPNTDAPDPR